jgi:hypothetical protein
MTEYQHARLLLVLLRERWDEAEALLSRGALQADPFVELCRQCGVHPWVHGLLDSTGRWALVGEPVRERLSEARAKVRQDNLLLLARFEQALDILREAGVRPVALKGADMLHRLYDRFDLRTLDDVDLLLSREHLRPALAALERAGWVSPAEPSRSHYIRSSHHLPVRSPGPLPVHFELHWNLAQASRFRIDVEGLLQRAHPIEIAGHQALRLDDVDLVAHLLLHHFTHYFDRGLKNLIDLRAVTSARPSSWAGAVERVTEWEASAASAASLLHMAKLWPELVPGEVLADLPFAGWRGALTLPLRSAHPLELYRGTRNRAVQLYLAAVMLERPSQLPGWLRHRAVRDTRPSDNPLDAP